MQLITIFKNKKLFLLNIFLTIYVAVNLIGGERGLLSYIDKKNIEKELISKELALSQKLNIIKNKNKLLSGNVDLDYLDTIYRSKFKLGKKDEIIIKLN